MSAAAHDARARVAAARPDLALLVAALRWPEPRVPANDGQWDLLIRLARSARLLGIVAARLEDAGLLAAAPTRARDLMASALTDAMHRRQMLIFEMAEVERALCPLALQPVLLKGAAYVVADLPLLRGRLPSDLDVMVAHADLERAEQALREAGWESEVVDDYDQRYYRAWSHEVPPLRLPGHVLEVDLHHTILPPLGRYAPDAAALLAHAVPVQGGAWRVLDACDRWLHAAVHLVVDSDFDGRLRDLVDLDVLARAGRAADAGFDAQLAQRARALGLQRPHALACGLLSAWLALDLAVPERTGAVDVVARLAERVLAPPHPDRERTPREHVMLAVLQARAHWLRMPLRLVLRHGAHKLTQALRPVRADTES